MDHVNRCPVSGRTKHFMEGVSNVKKWLIEYQTHPQLMEIMPKYLYGRGQMLMVNVCCTSPHMRKAAPAQDRVGWRHFTEGKLV